MFDFTLLFWRRWRSAPDEVPSYIFNAVEIALALLGSAIKHQSSSPKTR